MWRLVRAPSSGLRVGGGEGGAGRSRSAAPHRRRVPGLGCWDRNAVRHARHAKDGGKWEWGDAAERCTTLRSRWRPGVRFWCMVGTVLRASSASFETLHVGTETGGVLRASSSSVSVSVTTGEATVGDAVSAASGTVYSLRISPGTAVRKAFHIRYPYATQRYPTLPTHTLPTHTLPPSAGAEVGGGGAGAR
eukprot:7387967-Prymnesium_polylepis.2